MTTMLAIPPARRPGQSWRLCLLMGLTLLVVYMYAATAPGRGGAPPPGAAATRP